MRYMVKISSELKNQSKIMAFVDVNKENGQD